MGLFNHADNLKNEKIIGRINNTFHEFLVPGSRASPGHTSYVPYNLIFTQNSIFGEYLKQPSEIDSISLAVNPGDTETFLSYLSQGKVITAGFESFTLQGSVPIRIDYKKISKVEFMPFTVKKRMILISNPVVSCTMMSVHSGLLSHTNFIFDQSISQQVVEMLKTTSLASKVVSQ